MRSGPLSSNTFTSSTTTTGNNDVRDCVPQVWPQVGHTIEAVVRLLPVLPGKSQEHREGRARLTDVARNGKSNKQAKGAERHRPKIAYRKSLGFMVHGYAEQALDSQLLKKHAGNVQLIFTSPPFPLNTKKAYGNQTGDQYRRWLAAFAKKFRNLLAPDGSIVIELGNAWEPGKPVMSPLALRALIDFMDRGKLQLCQQFICDNPTRLPSPAQWVNVKRIRVKDSYTHVWWFAKTAEPKADNRRVLKPYSDSMTKLLKTRRYNSGPRPSGHVIGETSFFTDNKGAIPSNVITLKHTNSTDPYIRYCKDKGLPLHPARMPRGLAEFFIKFLTEPGDLVVDPFGGSNTTGAAAEELGRRWISIEPNATYIEGSLGRFVPQMTSTLRANGKAPKLVPA
jgi:DNA modification methylase